MDGVTAGTRVRRFSNIRLKMGSKLWEGARQAFLSSSCARWPLGEHWDRLARADVSSLKQCETEQGARERFRTALGALVRFDRLSRGGESAPDEVMGIRNWAVLGAPGVKQERGNGWIHAIQGN